MKQFCVKYWAKDEKGQKVLKEVPLTVEAYNHAAEKGMTLRQYAKHVAPDCDYSMGEPLDQMYAQSGLFDARKFNMPWHDPEGSDRRADGRCVPPPGRWRQQHEALDCCTRS